MIPKQWSKIQILTLLTITSCADLNEAHDDFIHLASPVNSSTSSKQGSSNALPESQTGEQTPPSLNLSFSIVSGTTPQTSSIATALTHFLSTHRTDVIPSLSLLRRRDLTPEDFEAIGNTFIRELDLTAASISLENLKKLIDPNLIFFKKLEKIKLPFIRYLEKGSGTDKWVDQLPEALTLLASNESNYPAFRGKIDYPIWVTYDFDKPKEKKQQLHTALL